MHIAAVVLFAVAIAVGTPAAAFYDENSGVVSLTAASFEETVVKSGEMWLVEFYAPWCGHCKNLAPEWKKAARALGGAVKLGAVDADAHSDLGSKYGVSAYPTIKFFNGGQKVVEYEGANKAQDIVKGALKFAKDASLKRIGETDSGSKSGGGGGDSFYTGTDVVELTDETFESEVLNPEGKGGWLVEFYAPWCGHCKNLAPEWKKAATELSGTIKIAAMDATVHKQAAEKYKVQGFPTIKFFPPGGAEPEEYNGGRSAADIIQYGQKKGELYPAAAPEVNQVKDQDGLTALCKDKTLCVVFIVPHVIDTGATGRNALLESFVKVASKLRARGAVFGWVVGGDHVAFEEGFGIFSSYPTFAAFNPTNLRYAVHKGKFGEEALLTSLKRILEGKTGLSQAKTLPKLSKGVELWDGKDYSAPEEEEL